MKETVLTAILILLSVFSVAQEKRILSLQECIDIAVENNLSVKRSELNLQSAEANLLQATGSRYPSVNLSGNYGYNWGRSIDPTTNQFVTEQTNFNGVVGDVSMPVINGFQITNTIKQRKVDKAASEYDLKNTINDISLNIALSYLNVIFTRELLENARFQLASSQQQLERTKKLVQSGALPVSNELQLSSQVATGEVNQVTAQNDMDLALLKLKQSMLLPPGQDIDIAIPELAIDQAEIASKNIQELYEVALSNRPEIQSADLRVKSATIGVDISKGGMYPTLGLSGSFSTTYSDAFKSFNATGPAVITAEPTQLQTSSGEAVLLNKLVAPGKLETTPIFQQYSNNLGKRLALSLNVPIFNGFRTRTSIQQSKIALQQAEIVATEQRNALYQVIESSYRNALAAAKTFAASQKQVASLEETFRAVENQYNNGAANYTDYQIAANNLFQAKTDLSRAKYDFVFKQKILAFYQGEPLTF